MHAWIAEELIGEQKKKRWAQKTSIFDVWVHHNVGGKHFVMAIWQTGITWAPTAQMLRSDYNGALEHVATNFASWTRRLARAVTRHQRHPATVEARIRSGRAFRSHGLTQQQWDDRAERAKARKNYYWTVDLHNKLKASKGRGKGQLTPKSWFDMSYNEKWWLDQLWKGRLRGLLDDAEAKCHRIQAPQFSMDTRGD